MGVPGTYVLRYAVSDTRGNGPAEATRTVVVADTTPPTITINGSASMSLLVGEAFVDAGFSAVDNSAAGASLITSSTVDTTSPGTYTVVYTALDASGNRASAARTVIVRPRSDDVGVFDPGTGIWYLRDASGATTSFYFGNPGDVAMMGDWDCDGIDTPGLYRQSDGFVYLRNSNSQGIADLSFFFGNPGDVPVAGDFNGNGCDTVSLYRPGNSEIFVVNRLGGNGGGLGPADTSFVFGDPGDQPFAGDVDGDGIDEVGLHRASSGFVYYRTTHTAGIADRSFFFGDPGDQVMAGRWGSAREETVAAYRPSGATFFLRFSNSQGNADQTVAYGNSRSRAVSGWFGSLPGGGFAPTPI
jgi:hypothetical protein